MNFFTKSFMFMVSGEKNSDYMNMTLVSKHEQLQV